MYCTQCGYNNPAEIKFCKNCDLDLHPDATGNERANQADVIVFAGFWVRFLAAFLDVLVLAAGVILLLAAIATLIAYNGIDSILYNRLAGLIFCCVVVFMSIAYYIFMESGIAGATLGKRWMNIRVLGKDGNSPSATRALARLIARQLSWLLFLCGYLIQPFNSRKQALHDMLASTVVVHANDSKKISVMATLMVLFFAVTIPLLVLFSTAGLPLYQQHILKVQLSTGLKIGREASLAVARFYRINGRAPSDIGDTAGHISLSPHVAGIFINQLNGEISVTLSDSVRNAIRNRHLIFTPTLEADLGINWKCHSNDIESYLLPDICK